jgi:oxygen-independent coproporphyrinogen-3 oxidase
LALNAEDRPRRDIIERLICDLHVDLAPFQTVEGSPDDGFASERARLAPMVDDGLVHINGDNIKVTEEGRAFVRSVCAVFDTYLQTSKGRHSSAV